MRIKRWVLTTVLLVLTATSCDACRKLTGTCCKTCMSGKACGDGCISSSETCHQLSGCACNGEMEVWDLETE
jgi:hypothetical protein